MAVKAPNIIVEPPGPKAREILGRDEEFIMQSFTRWYPLVVKRGEGAIVEDVDGNVYIDFNSGIAVLNIGHRHPRVVEAVKSQLEKLVHYSLTDFYYEEAVDAAEALASIAPISGGPRVFFTNSGTESVEAALKVSRGHFKGSRPYIISFIGAFHGRTMGSLSLGASKSIQKKWFHPLVPGIIHVPYPYPYRCPFKVGPEECGDAVIGYVEEWVLGRLVDPEEVSSIIVEPIQGEAGYIVPPEGFLRGLEKLARRHGMLLVADEVQTGFGRTGRWFAVEHWGVKPDLVATAKAIASGLPLGALIGRREVMDLPPGSHATTFGGNPVALAACRATINVIKEEGLVERADRLGREVLKYLKELGDSLEIVGDVRGKGFMIALELVEDPKTKKPAVKSARRVILESFKKGVLVIGGGFSTIRMAPPLNIPEELLWKGVEILADILKEEDKRRA